MARLRKRLERIGDCVLVVGDTVALAGAGREAWLFPLAGRAAALLVARVFPCARPGGLGQWFIDGVKWTHVLFAALLYAAAAFAASVEYGRMVWMPGTFAAMLGAFLLAAGVTLLVVSRFSRRIDGITGDIVGFSVEAAQLIYLLVAALLHGLFK